MGARQKKRAFGVFVFIVGVLPVSPFYEPTVLAIKHPCRESATLLNSGCTGQPDTKQ